VARRRRAAGPRSPWSTEAKTRARLWRPRLPLARGPPAATPPADQDQGGVAQGPSRLGPRPPALGGRAHDLLAAPVPTSARALRASRRHSPSASDDRLLSDLLQAASGRRGILKGALSGADTGSGLLRGTLRSLVGV